MFLGNCASSGNGFKLASGDSSSDIDGCPSCWTSSLWGDGSWAAGSLLTDRDWGVPDDECRDVEEEKEEEEERGGSWGNGRPVLPEEREADYERAIQWNLYITDMLGRLILSIIERLSSLWRSKIYRQVHYWCIEKCPLYSIMSFIRRVLCQRFHCI